MKQRCVSLIDEVYAQRLHITYKTLNHLCKLACQQTAKQLIDHYTILEAKRRLILTRQAVQQLAYDLGFEVFRVEAGKIAEHWDVIEPIAPKDQWKNENGKFGGLK